LHLVRDQLKVDVHAARHVDKMASTVPAQMWAKPGADVCSPDAYVGKARCRCRQSRRRCGQSQHRCGQSPVQMCAVPTQMWVDSRFRECTRRYTRTQRRTVAPSTQPVKGGPFQRQRLTLCVV
jgi:hypothetical protein